MTLGFVLAIALLMLVGVALGYSKLAGASSSGAAEECGYLEFDPSRYAVLTRLASTGDLRVARGWRGSSASIEKRLRQCRARAVRTYLHEMKADFQRLETVGRLMILSGATSLEFRQNLIEAKFQFTWLWWQVRLQFLLWQFGVGRFDAAALVAAFDRFVTVAGPLQAAGAEA